MILIITNSTLTNDYLTSAQIGVSYYNKSEVDGLIAGVSGGGVSNPIELVDANTSIKDTQTLQNLIFPWI